MMMREERLSACVAPLLDWYEKKKRTLPWRENTDPYRVWVSEIMLQQTRVSAVVPYYRRWMAELPAVEDLAAADEERLMKLWQGLGYYSRARNLKRAAERIVAQGYFPATRQELLRLPGVGEYTAGAVASIAFGEPVPAVDGNVLRVMARITCWEENILEPAVKRRFTQVAEQVVPADRPGAWNQALMELGATVCIPNGVPLCDECPLKTHCLAREQGKQGKLPVREKKLTRRQELLTVYVLLREGRVALRRRPETGLLAGLWEFPWVQGDQSEGSLPEEWGLIPVDWKKGLTAKHAFTHVTWHMQGFVVAVRGDCPDLQWVTAEELGQMAIPSAFARFLQEAENCLC